jgi:hypothetical protein
LSNNKKNQQKDQSLPRSNIPKLAMKLALTHLEQNKQNEEKSELLAP